jgi:hypothetical protein
VRGVLVVGGGGVCVGGVVGLSEDSGGCCSVVVPARADAHTVIVMLVHTA